ncbi:MAG: M17 family peptidase N-terminal domain-containing protein, partial [Pseudomonadota bacterium]
MRLTTRQLSPANVKTGALLLPVEAGGQLPATSALVDAACGGAMTARITSGDLGDSAGATLCLHTLTGVKAERILLVRLAPSTADYGAIEHGLYNAFAALAKTGAGDAVSYLATADNAQLDAAQRAHIEVCALHDVRYRFDAHKSTQPKKAKLTRITFAGTEKAHVNAIKRAVADADALYSGVALARDLGNTPPNVCTPDYLAQCAKSLAKTHPSVSVSILNESRMAKLGMGALLAVARGSRNRPKLISMSYQGASKQQRPVVLVGKGVTFDTGGISIKPSAAMDEMKFDMCG